MIVYRPDTGPTGPRSGRRSHDGALLAVSDLHVEHRENRLLVSRLRPRSDRDWLLVCGDVGDDLDLVDWALSLLCRRFERVIWVPGNHELLTWPGDHLRGERRYRELVRLCRARGALTPEDPYPTWDGPGGPATVVPLFLLYDYSFGNRIAATKQQALRRAEDAGVVCVDEYLLHPEPYGSREAWCRARVAQSQRRLATRESDVPTVLVNHFPLTREATEVLLRPEFAQWCGTELTSDWHLRFNAAAVVYGHLHTPRTTWHDGVRFEEVSVGYPRERAHRAQQAALPRQILPEPVE